MHSDWKIYGEYADLPVFCIDTWDGKVMNSKLKELLGDFPRMLIFWKDNTTEILKDGDEIEMDATNGVVRKL